MATKLQLVLGAYTELGLPPWTYTLAPEQIVFACERMDSMVAEWAASKNIRIGYNFEKDPNAEAGVAQGAENAITLQLALQLAPSLGKTPSPETLVTAEASWQALLIPAASPPQVQLPATMPRGAGFKPYRFSPYWNFVPQPDESQLGTSGNGTELDFKKD